MALVLVSNDDGFAAPGIRALVGELRKKHEVFTAVPDCDYSWIGTSSNTKIPVKLEKKRLDGITWHVFNSTPVDCVNIALTHLMKKTPDAVVSGINSGLNAGAVFSSGTIAAAEEGSLFGITGLASSVGFKDSNKFMAVDSSKHEFFSPAARITCKVLGELLKDKAAKGKLFNMNFPQKIVDEKIYLANAQQTFGRQLFEERNGAFHHLKPRSKTKLLKKDADVALFEQDKISLVPLLRFAAQDLSKWKKLVKKLNKR